MAKTLTVEDPKADPKARTTRSRATAKRAPKPAPPEEDDTESGIEPTEATEAVEESDDWMWLAQFTPADWDHMICYLHRTFPITDRKAGGKPVAIEKICRPFDVDTILKGHGSGGYRADIISIAKTGKQTRIRQFYFTIRNMQYPPQIPLGDWVQDSRNEEWLWAEPMLQAQQGRGGMQQDTGKLFQTILDGVERVQGKREDNTGVAVALLQMVKESQAHIQDLVNPATQLATVKSLMDALKPDKPAGTDPMMMIVLDMMKDQLKSTRDELAALRAKPQESLIEQLVKAAPVIKQLSDTFGFGKRDSSPNEWARVVEKVVEQTGEVIPDIVGAWKMKIAADKSKIPPPVTRSGKGANGSAAATTTAAEPTDDRMEAITQKYGQMLIAIAPFMIDHFKTELGGEEFRNWFISRQGIMAWTALRDEVGVDTVVQLVQMHETLKVALAPVEKFREFVQDFFSSPGGDEPPPDALNPDEITQPHANA